MDEEKKSEASGDEPERLGPYVIQEQVQQSHDSQEELYLATHETSGATALVRKHAAKEDAAARKDWRVIFGSWASRGYSAMEVEHTDWARALDRQSAESLLLTLESVLEEVRRMARAVSDTHEPRLRWSLGWGMASAAMVCALLFALVRLASVCPTPNTPEPLASAPPAYGSHEEPAAGDNPDMPTHGGLVDTADAGQSVLARPLPREPFKGQKRPPCHRYAEVELVGACWLPHKLKAPCPDVLYEHEGECYSPAFSAKPPPSSLGQ
ncbi:hypothetical protein D187_003713 [Cystobacter fuscus DSM 2262]|uniref:Uncharacterized protein n=1 Tax=Cystobacter fuscus (strain ATCC 25194 / DSM 2262 / NBRC 100088 / M29) TaxID=1242864 RepID=S9P909_CYSF2|nr:hypothetical protein [Cystobacter fuscus]EPX58752.1 hypothetical protein D187_003713 [Cystobacter fuscus DSM 2262]